MEDKLHSGKYNLSFSYNPGILRTGDAINIVKKYTYNWQHNNDWDEVSFYVNGLPYDKVKELESELAMEDTYGIEIEKSRFEEGGEVNSYAKGGDIEVGDWVAQKKGTARGQVYRINNLGIFLKDKYGNESNRIWLERELKHSSKPRYEDGGNVTSNEVVKFFNSIDYSKLPAAFSDYVKKEILTDEDLEYISPNEPVFIEIKGRIEDRLNKQTSQEPISDEKRAVMKEIEDLQGLIEFADGEELTKLNKEIEDLNGLLSIL